MKHTYILKSKFIDTDWHQAHTDNTMLLQGNQPWIFHPRMIILTDAYQHVTPEAFSFIENCYDKKIAGTKDNPAVFTYPPTEDVPAEECDKIECFWDQNTFHMETICMIVDYNVIIDYHIYQEDDENVVFMPIAKWFRGVKYNDTQERLFTAELFDTYGKAQAWLDNFKQNHKNTLNYHTIDIVVANKTETENEFWYRIQKDILEHTHGYSEEFEKNFDIYGRRMYQKLFGKDALTALENEYFSK